MKHKADTTLESSCNSNSNSNSYSYDSMTKIELIFNASDVSNEALLQTLVLRCEKEDIDTRNTDGYTPVHIASREGHHNCLSLLIAAGADINIPINSGETPVYIASSEGHDKCVSVLIVGMSLCLIYMAEMSSSLTLFLSMTA